ncbi:MAG: RNA polymerase sigma factor FliA [Sulfuricellaceae bacterium]|jgi:RNA polymerase sigma factor for flagellar operon FliA
MYRPKGLPDKEQAIADHLPLVKRIAFHLIARLPHSVQVEDLVQAGMIGLMDAINNFDPGQGAQFETYASQRIRGAMLDELRQVDWLPRSARKNLRQIEKVIHTLEQKLGRSPSETEAAEALGVPLAEYQQMLQDGRGHQLVYYEDFYDSDEGDNDFLDRHLADSRENPLEKIQDDGFRATLVEAIRGLPEREKLVMGLYYEEELNLREIGEVLGVTESRVCQLHSQAIARLRSRLKDWLE